MSCYTLIIIKIGKRSMPFNKTLCRRCGVAVKEGSSGAYILLPFMRIALWLSKSGVKENNAAAH